MIDQAYKLREYYHSSSLAEKQNIISVTSGKGGTGKTFFSFYLSQFLAAQGYKTLLVEFDFNLGSLAYHLDYETNNTIGDFFLGSILFDELPVEIQENFSIIFGDSGKINYPENLSSQVEKLLQKLLTINEKYDFIILDNGAGIGSHIFESLKYSAMNLIVTLPDPVSIMDAYVVIKLMAKNSINIPKGIIINKCESQDEGQTAFNNLNSAAQHFFNEELNLVGIFTENKDFQNLSLHSTTLKTTSQNSKFLSELTRSAKRITTIAQLANNHQLQKKS
jgi:flagellar biosynthesis protein FlhG